MFCLIISVIIFYVPWITFLVHIFAHVESDENFLHIPCHCGIIEVAGHVRDVAKIDTNRGKKEIFCHWKGDHEQCWDRRPASIIKQSSFRSNVPNYCTMTKEEYIILWRVNWYGVNKHGNWAIIYYFGKDQLWFCFNCNARSGRSIFVSEIFKIHF